HVLVLARNQLWTHLDDRHRGTEAPVHLGKFEPDIAAADNNQVPRHAVEGEDGAGGQERHGVDAGQRRHRRSAADIEKDAGGGQPAAQWWTRLTGADDNRVEAAGHRASVTIRTAARIATASSISAAGLSLRNAAANRSRVASPPYVPITAPRMPAMPPMRSR